MRIDLQILGERCRKGLVGRCIRLLSVCAILMGCLPGAHALQDNTLETAGEKIKIVDARGRTIAVKLPVKKIVVLTSDALEVIRAIDAQGLVMGVNSGISDDPRFWPQLKDRPSIGSWRNPNYELIAQLDPDLVIGYAQRPGPGMEKKLASLGIQVVRLDFYKLNTFEQEVKTLGRILDREKAAGRLIKWYRGGRDLIQKRLKRAESRPSVYVEGYSKYHGAGPGSGGNEMCLMAGGRNVAEDFAIPYPEVTPEWVLVKNPSVIIKAATLGKACGTAESDRLKAIKREIMARPAWDNIRAVREGKVYVLESSIWTGPRAIIGVMVMAKRFHPVLFKDVDPEEYHGAYLQEFQGIQCRGVFED